MPAVTRVEEWTRAEIGVGAAIAAGSQAEKGNCALLEIAAVNRSSRVIVGNKRFDEICHEWVVIRVVMAKMIQMSPTRLERMVIVPEAFAVAF